MIMTKIRANWIVLVVFVLAASQAYGADPGAIVGVWSTKDNDAKVEIYKCGNYYCGKIVHLARPNYPPNDKEGMGGLPKVDRHNPDPKLRNQPLLGLELLRGFHYDGDNSWTGGEIYDPDNGKTYKSQMTLPGPDRLNLRGYIGIPLLGRTETWTR
jgi:uncharacterized protein (DUF2147 family)